MHHVLDQYILVNVFCACCVIYSVTVEPLACEPWGFFFVHFSRCHEYGIFHNLFRIKGLQAKSCSAFDHKRCTAHQARQSLALPPPQLLRSARRR